MTSEELNIRILKACGKFSQLNQSINACEAGLVNRLSGEFNEFVGEILTDFQQVVDERDRLRDELDTADAWAARAWERRDPVPGDH